MSPVHYAITDIKTIRGPLRYLSKVKFLFNISPFYCYRCLYENTVLSLNKISVFFFYFFRHGDLMHLISELDTNVNA